MYSSIPRLKTDIVLGTLGFYEYRRMLDCPFGGISNDKLLESGTLPASLPNKQLIVGLVFHELMEISRRVSTRVEFQNLSRSLLDKMEKEYLCFLKTGNYGSPKGWAEVGKALRIAMANLNGKRKAKSSREGLLFSGDGKFKGIPDKYQIEGTVGYLTEYKSAAIFEEDNLKQSHFEQILFYSFLIKENHPEVRSVRTKVLSLSGDTYEHEFSIEDLENYKNELSKNYLELESSIEKKNFSFEICVSCSKKTICDKFITNSQLLEDKRPVFVVNGFYQSANIKPNCLILKVGGNKIEINGFPYDKKELKNSARYVLFNLKKRKGNLYWSDYTGIYEIA